MLQVNINTDELQAKLNNMAKQLTGPQMGRAIALAINKTVGTRSGGARTQADREIRKVFNLRQKYVLRQLKVKSASIRDFVGEVKFPTTPIPMSEFMGTRGGTKSGRRRRATPIRVSIIKGQTKTVQGAFFLKTKYGTGGRMIMHRSEDLGGKSYSDNRFKFRHKRINHGKGTKDLTIGAIFSPSPFGAEMNDRVKQTMQKYLEDNLMKNIFGMLDAMAAGHIKESNRRGGRYRR